jgi:hypothetical protein
VSKPNRRLREQFERRVSELLSRPLADLQSRGWLPPALGGFSSVPVTREAQHDRMREVIERDRALREASPSEPALSPASSDPPFEVELTSIEARSAVSNDEVTIETATTQEPAAPAADEEAVTPVESGPSRSSPARRARSACREPIRTRTMAKLLLAQGHPQRALSIYDALIAEGADDPVLLAEADALRSLQT